MYFSGSDVAITAIADNGDHIELDAPLFQFQVSRAKLPIYGYKSVRFDTVADGEELVQGQFILNFTDSAQLAVFADRTKAGQSPKKLKEQDLSDVHIARIDIYYNHRHAALLAKTDEYKQYTLLDIHLQSIGQSINSGGDPIGESYNFLARGISHSRPRPKVPLDLEEPDMISDVAVQKEEEELDFGDFSVWEPLLPLNNQIVIHYNHTIYPLIWARTTYTIPGIPDVSTSWNWFHYKGCTWVDEILKEANNAESTSAIGTVQLAHCINAKEQAPMDPHTRPRVQNIDTSIQFNLQPNDMEVRDDISGSHEQLIDSTIQVDIGTGTVSGRSPVLLEQSISDGDVLKMYYSKDYLQAVEQGEPWLIHRKYGGMISTKLEESIASTPGLHLISVTKISFPVHYLLKADSPTSQAYGWKWLNANETIDYSAIEPFTGLLSNVKQAYYSNGKSLFFSGSVDTRDRSLLSDTALTEFLISNIGDWILDPSWEPQPDPPNTDNLA